MARARSRAVTVFNPARQSAPIIRVNVPRARSAPKPKRRSSRRSGGGGGSFNDTLMKVAIGAGVLGFVDKQFTNLPTIPILGKKGTIAVAAYFLSNKGRPGIARDVCLAAVVLAANELARDGRVSGDDD